MMALKWTRTVLAAAAFVWVMLAWRAATAEQRFVPKLITRVCTIVIAKNLTEHAAGLDGCELELREDLVHAPSP